MPVTDAAPSNFLASFSGLIRRSAAVLMLAGAGAAQAGLPVLSTIHVFNGGSEGGIPTAPVIIGSDGNLYGTTSTSGYPMPGWGTVYKLTPQGQLTVLHTFTSASGAAFDGASPDTRLVQAADGSLYGATLANNGSPSSNYGVVYKIAPNGTEAFVNGFGLPNPYGASNVNQLRELILGSDGELYGAAGSGAGSYSCGTLYRMTTGGVIDFSIFSFGFTPDDGCTPGAGLVQASDGNFYGETQSSPPNTFSQYAGTLFRFTPDGQFTTLYQFPTGGPVGKLALGPDGALYGMASSGIFRMTLDGSFTTLYPFNVPTFLVNDLVLGDDGAFYGQTLSDGYFRYSTDGSMVTFGDCGCSFGKPASSLTPDGTGSFYLTTQDSPGTVSRLTPPTTDVTAQITLSATSTTVASGSSTTINWTAANSSSCTGHTAQGFWGTGPLGTSDSSGSYIVTTTYPNVGPQTYWLECQSASTDSPLTTTRALTINVVPAPPSVTLTVSPTTIALSDTATVSWSGQSVSSCAASGAWSGTKAVSGSQTVQPKQTGNGMFKISCTGNDGSMVSASAVLTVTAPPPPALVFTVSYGRLVGKEVPMPLGQSALLGWYATYAKSCLASGAWSGTEPHNGGLFVTPTAAGSYVYTLTCNGIAGGTTRGSVKLVVH